MFLSPTERFARPFVHYRGFAEIRRAHKLAKAAFLCDAAGRRVLRIDDADRALPAEVRIAPCDGGENGLGREPLTVKSRHNHPAKFRRVFDRRFDFATEVGKSNLAQECATRRFLDNPIAEA
jgi:hypothetical protein